jgi:hypothetical protein
VAVKASLAARHPQFCLVRKIASHRCPKLLGSNWQLQLLAGIKWMAHLCQLLNNRWEIIGFDVDLAVVIVTFM